MVPRNTREMEARRRRRNWMRRGAWRPTLAGTYMSATRAITRFERSRPAASSPRSRALAYEVPRAMGDPLLARSKSPRVANHSPLGVIELMPTSDGETYGFKYVNGHPA